MRITQETDLLIDVADINKIQNYISEIVSPTRNLIMNSSRMQFISINKELISEKEFLTIVDMRRKQVTSRTGLYQEKLYGNYISAKEDNDTGYLNDVLQCAIELRDNLSVVKDLMKNKVFMKEWKKNIGGISPLKELKNTGSMKRIEHIKNMI